MSELKDFLAYVLFLAPDFEDADIPSMSLNAVFNIIHDSLEHLRTTLGALGHARLSATANGAKAWFAAGDDDTGAYVVQHMEEYLRLKRFKTDEDVIDDARFAT